ncbi:hypothetical protein [Chachezhania antarctica]|uniref:hypothetical protein n=1 Tax=Chachezhania antarctica TaxID=2340860 RepID=UPI0013CEBC87|nr:hypothetical protein [Chachezhania antarctica]
MSADREYLTAFEDAVAYEKRLQRDADWHPVIAVVGLSLIGWWYGLNMDHLAFYLIGLLMLAVYREILLTRAQIARVSAIWIREQGKCFPE